MKLGQYKSSNVDINLVLLLTVFYTVFEIIHILKISFFLHQRGLPWPKHFTGILIIDWMLVIGFMIFVAISTKQLILKKVAWSNIFLLHFLLSILISFLIRFAADLYFMTREGIPLRAFNFEKFSQGLMANLDINFVIYFAMLLIIHTYYYQQEMSRNEIQRETLKSQLLTTRIKMLTSQLQPHFLFNTLNGISSLIGVDKKQAQDMVSDLGDFLREILYHSDSNFTSVQKEMDLLRKYLNLLQIRYWEKFSSEENIEEATLDLKIPTMVLQPLVENAIKHGFSPKHEFLRIKISIRLENGLIVLSVENDGKELRSAAEFTPGVGLDNIKERLLNIYGKEHSFAIENKKDNSGVICTVKLPLMNKKNSENCND